MGFFLRQSENTSRWAASTLEGWDTLSHEDIVKEIGGSNKYFCYVLADFDPIRAEEFAEKCTVEQITKAMLAKLNHKRPPDD